MRAWNFQDLTGKRFGRLLVLGIAYKKPRKSGGTAIYWRCRCECGKEVIVAGNNLKRETQSCGCLHKEGLHKTHGLSYNKYYRTWADIKKRCYNPNSKDYPNYGARGITMYEGWINDFQAFFDYISTLPHFGEDGYSLDRENNDGNYEPGNLRFATQTQQNRNTRRNIVVEYDGREMCLTEAAELSGIAYSVLIQRYHAGDRGEKLFRPVETKFRPVKK